MTTEELKNAFLDRQLLKLDEGALAFVFGRELVDAAKSIPEDDASKLILSRKKDLTGLMVHVSSSIVKETFYDKLFEELAETEEELAHGFIRLALTLSYDEDIEAARALAVSKAAEGRGGKKG